MKLGVTNANNYNNNNNKTPGPPHLERPFATRSCCPTSEGIATPAFLHSRYASCVYTVSSSSTKLRALDHETTVEEDTGAATRQGRPASRGAENQTTAEQTEAEGATRTITAAHDIRHRSLHLRLALFGRN